MLQLVNFDKFAEFSTDQIKMMISFRQSISEDHDYALQVLLPELMVLLLVNKFTISKEEAQQYMLDLDFFHIPWNNSQVPYVFNLSCYNIILQIIF